jgi:hypothetical protein
MYPVPTSFYASASDYQPPFTVRSIILTEKLNLAENILNLNSFPSVRPQQRGCLQLLHHGLPLVAAKTQLLNPRSPSRAVEGLVAREMAQLPAVALTFPNH